MFNYPAKPKLLYFSYYNERLQNYKDLGNYINNIQTGTYAYHRNFSCSSPPKATCYNSIYKKVI